MFYCTSDGSLNNCDNFLTRYSNELNSDGIKDEKNVKYTERA